MLAGHVAVAVVIVVPACASGPSTSARATCTGAVAASVEQSAYAVTASVAALIPDEPNADQECALVEPSAAAIPDASEG